jgi:predicted transcriptional regulator
MLEKNMSINKIAQVLNLSRSSLKDYVNSRALKDLAQVKKTLPKHDNDTNALIVSQNIDLEIKKECALITQN